MSTTDDRVGVGVGSRVPGITSTGFSIGVGREVGLGVGWDVGIGGSEQ